MTKHQSRACALIILSITFVFSAQPKGKDANIRVLYDSHIKGKTTLALGAFRVAFVTEDSAVAVSHGALSHGGSAARMTGELSGVEHALMQKITDAIYADFLKQAAAKGYQLIDSATLAKTSTAYAELPSVENFLEGRLGTFVIPTGQRSVTLAADDSAREAKGAAGLGTGFRNIGKNLATSPANKAFPAASGQVNAPVLGVTIVVNFANFKGTNSGFGTSKATITPGATIDGRNPNEIVSSTSIVAWDSTTKSCANCQAQFVLEGQIHSTANIGASTTRSAMKAGDHIANGIGALSGIGGTKKKATTIEVDAAAYETNVLLVAAQASDLLLSSLNGK